jgi:hypothetical protein
MNAIQGKPMKLKLTLIVAALACGGAFAQAPAGTVARPAQEQNPNMSGGVAQQRGEMRNDMRTGMDHSAMDMNRDGMISQKEWNDYHASMWRDMKADKKGMVPWADVNTRMMGNAQGGPVGIGGQVGANGSSTPK